MTSCTHLTTDEVVRPHQVRRTDHPGQAQGQRSYLRVGITSALSVDANSLYLGAHRNRHDSKIRPYVQRAYRWPMEVRFMGSIRRLESKGTLFLDFRYAGQRLREYTTLPDTSANRKRLLKVLERIEGEIALSAFDYQKPRQTLACRGDRPPQEPMLAGPAPGALKQPPAQPRCLAIRRGVVRRGRGDMAAQLQHHATRCTGQIPDPLFGDKEVGQITKADVLAFRASLAKVPARKSSNTLSNRRINSIMKPCDRSLTKRPTGSSLRPPSAISNP